MTDKIIITVERDGLKTIIETYYDSPLFEEETKAEHYTKSWESIFKTILYSLGWCNDSINELINRPENDDGHQE